MISKISLEGKLKDIFAVILELDDSHDFQSLRRINANKWDSLAHTSMIVAIESEFGIRLEIADMERMTSFASTLLLLREKGL